MQDGDDRDHHEGLSFDGYGGENEAGSSVIAMAEHDRVQLEQRAAGGDGSRQSQQFMAINSAQAYNPLAEPYFHYNALLQVTAAAPAAQQLCVAPPPPAENPFSYPHHNPAGFPPLIDLLSSSSPPSATSAAATALFHAHHPHADLQPQPPSDAAVNLRKDQHIYSPDYNMLIANHDIATGDSGLYGSLTGHPIDNQRPPRALPSSVDACNSASANTDAAADAARVSTTSTNNSMDTADNIAEDDAAKGPDPVRAKIIAHPAYPRLVVAYTNCHKVGAPPDVASSLDEISREYETFHHHAAPSAITAFGHDPELDDFMEAYCDVLHKYQEELTRPFTESMLFFKKIEQQLNALCKGSASTFSSSPLPGSQPGWSDDRGGGNMQDMDGNGGGRILSEEQLQEEEEEEEEGSGEIIDYVNSNNGQDASMSSTQHPNADRSNAASTAMIMGTLGQPAGAVVMDPQAEEQRIKAQLLRKYSGYFSSLKKEFLKKKKKGKLPKDARQKLLDWWTQHYRWPYPSEAEKTALAECTGLDQKQINNWFINQRKRHWKPSEDMQCVMMINLHASAIADNPPDASTNAAHHNINSLAPLPQACHINANVKNETDSIMHLDQR